MMVLLGGGRRVIWVVRALLVIDRRARLRLDNRCLPRPAHARFRFAELPDNAGSCYAAAARATLRWPTIRVLFTDEDGTRCKGFGGRLEVRAGLLAAGVPADNLEEV